MKNSETPSVARKYVEQAFRVHINCTQEGFERALERNEKELSFLGEMQYVEDLHMNGCITPKMKNKLLSHCGLVHDEFSAKS